MPSEESIMLRLAKRAAESQKKTREAPSFEEAIKEANSLLFQGLECSGPRGGGVETALTRILSRIASSRQALEITERSRENEQHLLSFDPTGTLIYWLPARALCNTTRFTMYEIRNMLKGNEGHRCNLMGREVVDPFEILREDQAGMHVASIFDAVNTMKGLGLRTEARPYQEFVNTNGLTKSESLDKEKLDYFTLRSGLAIDGQILDLAEFRYLD